MNYVMRLTAQATSSNPAWNKFIIAPQSSSAETEHNIHTAEIANQNLMVAGVTDMGFDEETARSALAHVVRWILRYARQMSRIRAPIISTTRSHN